jgi:peptidoglycan/LPS O-acetylase OafA/YrhL
LDFLDGIRGLAALYVVIMHSAMDVDWTHTSSWLFAMSPLISEGKLAVAVFIVLSGFCLTLPVANAGGTALRGGIWAYIRSEGLGSQ